MKKILYVLFILSMVGLILFNMVSAKDEFDLFKIASILEHENVSIHKWSLHSRELLETVQTKQEAVHKVDQLKKKFIIGIGTFLRMMTSGKRKPFTPKKDVNESIRIMQTVTDRQVQTYIVYEVNGKGWGEETREFIEGSILNRINDIFHGKSTTFSCVYGDFGDKMSKSLSESCQTAYYRHFKHKKLNR